MQKECDARAAPRHALEPTHSTHSAQHNLQLLAPLQRAHRVAELVALAKVARQEAALARVLLRLRIARAVLERQPLRGGGGGGRELGEQASARAEAAALCVLCARRRVASVNCPHTHSTNTHLRHPVVLLLKVRVRRAQAGRRRRQSRELLVLPPARRRARVPGAVRQRRPFVCCLCVY